MTTLNTPEQIDLFRLMTLRSMLKLEIAGMKRSKGRTAYALLKDELCIGGTRQSVLEQSNDIINQLKEEMQ